MAIKVMTVLGTRPEIIRLSRVIEKLDRLCDHKLVHTGQNYEDTLSSIFFRELRVRQPDYYLGVRGDTFGQQAAQILAKADEVLRAEHPDAVLVLGDTNSGLSSIVAKRMGIPVFHMEAGNRCYDDRVPEEVNRRIIDHCSTILMPYTRRSKENLVREWIPSNRVYVTGNPIYEVMQYYDEEIHASPVLAQLDVEPGRYFLITLHRAENVDVETRLAQFARAFDLLQKKYDCPIVCSLHPHTRSKMQEYGIGVSNPRVQFLAPLGFFDFVALERSAWCVLSDSGTVQEECCILRTPSVTLRDVTERPETIESGSNMLSGADPDLILRCVETVLSQRNQWQPPEEYLEPDVSSKVVKIVLGYSPVL